MNIQYQNIIEKPDFFRNMNKQDFLHYQIGTKAKAWEHEEEVRLYMRGNMLLNVINFNKEPYFLEINGECFETLYLGVRIEDKNKNEIVNAARKLNPNIFFLCEIVQFYSMRGRMNNTVNGEDPYYIEGEEA